MKFWFKRKAKPVNFAKANRKLNNITEFKRARQASASLFKSLCWVFLLIFLGLLFVLGVFGLFAAIALGSSDGESMLLARLFFGAALCSFLIVWGRTVWDKI